MTGLALVTGVADAGLLGFTVFCLQRSRRRGASLRLRIFAAMAFSTLFGALVTGAFAVFADRTIGFEERAARVLPKAFLLSVTLLPIAAAAAAVVGRRLARSMEELTDAATRIADGHRVARLPRGNGGEAQRLARALTSMRRELEGMPYAAAFLRDAWHDLKTPVAALRATLEILEDDAFDDPRAARNFLKNFRKSTDQLDRRLADLVTLARYETAAIDASEPTSMRVVVDSAMARIEPLAEAKGVLLARVRRSSGGEERATDALRCNPDALTRALGNLLENAVHATPGGSIKVAVDDDARDTIVVDVINEPSEVPLDVRLNLFERCMTSRKSAGSGLGLAIVRAAVEAHGGQIRFVEMGPPRVHVRIELPR